MDDYTLVILLVAIAFAVQIIIWMIQDTADEKRKDDEIERWLDGGKG